MSLIQAIPEVPLFVLTNSSGVNIYYGDGSTITSIASNSDIANTFLQANIIGINFQADNASVSFTPNTISFSPSVPDEFIQYALGSLISQYLLNNTLSYTYNSSGSGSSGSGSSGSGSSGSGSGSGSSGSGSSEDHTPVSVNLNVLVDADSSVSVFGDVFTTPNNIVIAEYALPVNALYDGVDTKGLLEMWEPVDSQGDIKVKLASTNGTTSGGENLTGAYEVTLKKLAKGLQKVLCNKLDCSDAEPFNHSKYSGVEEYKKQRDFGRLALATLAHYFFGHVDATAAITNDAAFVKAMLSITDGEEDETPSGPDTRYASWTGDVSGDVSIWSDAASATDANLAVRLALAVYNKGVNSSDELIESSVSANDAASLANIVRQVIGQDAQRTKNRDGSERTKDVHQLVRFYPGDVIYVNIKIKTPTVTIGAGQIGVTSNSLTNNIPVAAPGEVDKMNYTIKITLGARDASL